jgi:virginiamycin B lyase
LIGNAMNKHWAVIAIGGSLGFGSVAGAAPVELVLAVPGFADFLAVDGDSVWVTNAGRVERWSKQGKLATVKMKHPCGAMTITAGSLWVADCNENTLNRIDIATGRRTAVIPTGLASPDGEMNVVSGAGSVWVASDKTGVIARVDPATNTVVASVAVNPGSCYLAFGFDALWVVSASGKSLQKVDPATNTVVVTTQLGRQPGFLAAGEGGVWVQEQGDGTVARIDPATGHITGRVSVDETLKYGDIDTGGGRVWLRTTAKQTYVVINAVSLAVVARIGQAAGSGALRYTPTGVWTTAHDRHTLSWWHDPASVAN